MLQNDPDRLFPIEPSARARARDLYDSVVDLPILSPHGHVDPRMLVDDEPFANAAELFIRYDHYVTRILHSAGVGLDRLGVQGGDGAPVAAPREVWRTFCENWPLYAGTASGYWLRSTFAEQFGLTEQPDASNADRLFDTLGTALATDSFRPRALFDSFGIEVLATTDDPLDDLAAHAALAADPHFTGRVLPTFRPDAYLDPSATGWTDSVARLAGWNGSPVSSYQGYLDALEGRRRYFADHGAVSADHGVLQPLTLDLSPSDAAALFERGLAGALDPAEARAFAGHMLLQMARMSTDDGLVMTVHAGVLRNHDTPTFQRFGADMGNDLPVATHFVEPLRPLLQRYGNTPGFHLVLFGAISRE